MMSNNGIVLKDEVSTPAPGTFCGFKVNGIECRPIDYIFHSLQWKASAYKVISDNDGTYYPSDHLPVMLTLTLQ